MSFLCTHLVSGLISNFRCQLFSHKTSSSQPPLQLPLLSPWLCRISSPAALFVVAQLFMFYIFLQVNFQLGVGWIWTHQLLSDDHIEYSSTQVASKSKFPKFLSKKQLALTAFLLAFQLDGEQGMKSRERKSNPFFGKQCFPNISLAVTNLNLKAPWSTF